MRTKSWFLSAVVAAFFFRVLIGYSGPNEPGDVARFKAQAASIATGNGFARYGALETRLPPGYPMFLAMCSRLGLDDNGVKFFQIALSTLSCIFVFQAIPKESTKCKWFAFLGMAFSPYLAFRSRILMSETLSVLIASLIVLFISRIYLTSAISRSDKKTKIQAMVFLGGVGVLSAFLVLTAPATIFLVYLLIPAIMITNHYRVRGAVVIGMGFLVALFPWQIHCVYAGQGILPLVYDLSGEHVTSGFRLWTRTWITSPDQTQVWFSDQKFEQIAPDWAFDDELPKSLARRYRADNTGDALFKSLADRKRDQHPLFCRLFLIPARAFTVWTHSGDLWPAQASYVLRLGPGDIAGDVYSVGASRSALRLLKGLYSTFAAVVNLAYFTVFLFLAWRAVRSRWTVAWAIVLGVVLYSAAGAYLPGHEIRRNLPFYPFLFLLVYQPFTRGPDLLVRKINPQSRVGCSPKTDPRGTRV